MNVYETIITRSSNPKLSHPAPQGAKLDQILKAGLSAPDYGKIRPCRFLIVEGAGLESLGEAFARSAKELDPDLDEDRLNRFRNLPQRAPMVIVVIAETIENHKIPVQEQVLATGAAVQNMLLVSHALEFGAIWRTGALAYNPYLKKHLGYQEKDEIVAFLYLGTRDSDKQKNKEPLIVEKFVSHWS